MTDFQKEMNQLVDGLVAQIADIALREAHNIIAASFGGDGAKARGVTISAARSPGRPRGGRGVKRSAGDLEALSEQFASFVKSNPGLRIEQINKELGTTTKDLALPIRKLVAEGRVAVKGQKRSTAYFPGKKAGKN